MQQTIIVSDIGREFLSTQDVKDALKINYSDDNTYLRDIINGARKNIEKYCSISIGLQTLQTIIDVYAYQEYEIPFGPVYDITNFKMKTAAGTYTTATANKDYETDMLDFKTFIPYSTGRWQINYRAGYQNIPLDLKAVWIRLVAFYFENRGDMDTIPNTIKRDLMNYKRLYVL